MATVVRMPEVLTGVTEATITTWLVEEGQQVVAGTPLAEVETEKAVVEYASEVAGTVLELVATAGVAVPIGDPIAVVGERGERIETTAPPPVPAADGAAPVAPAGAPSASSRLEPRLFASPLVRRLARERDLDLSTIAGSGPNGRIVRRDIERLPTVASEPAARGDLADRTDRPPSGSDGDVEEIAVTPMRRAIARRLTESATTVPHFALEAHCRMERLLALRADINEGAAIRVSVTDILLKAVAGALREVPEANATWGEAVIRRHRRADIAVAIAIEGGLVTPVVRDVDALTLTQISAATSDLAARARAGRLRQDELEGGTLTLSNLGMHGVAAFTAIINPPHSGILAIGAVREVPVVTDGQLGVGTMMSVTLSADHRVLDGALAARFLGAFVRRVENPVTMLV